jgi:hypothetical protein
MNDYAQTEKSANKTKSPSFPLLASVRMNVSIIPFSIAPPRKPIAVQIAKFHLIHS